jgi:hypothetical protein
VLDLKDAPLKMLLGLGIQLYPKFEKLLDNYDDIYSDNILINSPLVFVGVWSVFKRVVKESSARKVTVLRSTSLRRFAREEELPREYGGICKICPPGLFGCRYSDQGPWLDAPDAQTWCFKDRDTKIAITSRKN